ncbi:hypothetical protein FOZ63_024486, partial [Perkinsus olseni]
MRYIPSLSIITLTVVRASIDDPAEVPVKKGFGHSLKRLLSRSKPRKDVAPVEDHVFFYDLHRPQDGSEFSSLSASSAPSLGPRRKGRKTCAGVLHGFLPSPNKLKVVGGEVRFGDIGLKFREEAISDDKGQSASFMRLVEAKCPLVEDILSPPTGSIESYVHDYSFPSEMDATVFPAGISRVLHCSDSDEEDVDCCETSGMYEIRMKGKSDDALKEALELLYGVVPPPSWAHQTADLSTITANEYFILAIEISVDDDFRVKSKDTVGRRLSQLIVENVTVAPLSNLRPRKKLEALGEEEIALMHAGGTYHLALGSRPNVDSLEITPDGIVKAGEAEIKFNMAGDKILVLEEAKCPRWSRPTPRKLPSVHRGSRIFPAIFDDTAIFPRNRVYAVGVLVSAVKTGSLQEAVAGLLHSSRGETIVKEGTTTYLFNNPAYGSEFGSLSTHFSSRENPKKIKVRPWSLLPSSARLQISSKGFVEAGSIGLEFDKETPLWNGDSHPFLRLRSATCPSLQHLLSPLDEGSEWVFPVAKLEDEDQVHGKKQRHDGE